MAVYDNNISNISVNVAAISSLGNNSGKFISTLRYCHIANCSSNSGCISVAPSSSVGIIRRNMGKISLMECGSVGSIELNAGNITLSERNSIGKIEHNSGKITVEASSVIQKISDNCGAITIEDNCTICVIEGNRGKIKLGNNCVVKSIIGAGGNLQWGFGCNVPTTTRTPSIPPSFTSVHINNFTGTMTVNSNGINFTGMMAGTQTFPQTHSVSRNNIQQPALPPPINPTHSVQDQSTSEDLICAICMDNKKDTAFNCGHTCCDSCSKTLIYCHICRQHILQKIKIYL